MTLSEATYYLAEKLSEAIPENDRVFQINDVSGEFVYYDSSQTVRTYDSSQTVRTCEDDETGAPELWVVSIRPGGVE